MLYYIVSIIFLILFVALIYNGIKGCIFDIQYVKYLASKKSLKRSIIKEVRMEEVTREQIERVRENTKKQGQQTTAVFGDNVQSEIKKDLDSAEK